MELVGIEPTTSSLRTMRSPKTPQIGVHLAADYGPKRSKFRQVRRWVASTISPVCIVSEMGIFQQRMLFVAPRNRIPPEKCTAYFDAEARQESAAACISFRNSATGTPLYFSRTGS